MFLISVIIALSLFFVGYLYGKLINKFIPSLVGISTTLIGLFLIFALFQVFTFLGMTMNYSVSLYVVVLAGILMLAPTLCILLKVDIKLKKHDIFGFLFALFTTILLVMLSIPLNTGAMFFDSNYYLSKVIESSVANVFGHVSNYSGTYLYRLDALYDYQGYYYFWGIVLKLVRNIGVDSNASLTPIYIWSASLTYYASLGYLTFMSCQAFFKKLNYKTIVPILFIVPYFINYFNTTLGFFGNSIKVVSVGLCLLVIYVWFKEKDSKLFYLLPFIYLAGISFSSSSFYLFVFIIVAFFFVLIFTNETNMKVYRNFVLSCLPIIIYMMIILAGWEMNAQFVAVLVAVIYLISLPLTIVLDKCSTRVILNIVSTFKYVFYLLVLILIMGSFLLRNSEFGYSFYFELRSLNDMTLNFTNNIDLFELIRNGLLWTLLCLLVLSLKRKKNKEICLILIFVFILFLNPFTMPVVATYITGVVYSRTFEIIVNPFVLLYLVSLVDSLKSSKLKGMLNICIGGISLILILNNLYQPYSRILINDENYNWEYKLNAEEYEMMNVLTNEVVSKGLERPLILSQNFNVKGYVPNIQLVFSTQDLRDTISSQSRFESSELKEVISLFYPWTYIDDDIFGHKPNYKNLCPVILKSNADYVIMKTTLILPNENGDFVPIWWDARACADSIYDNSEWVILKVKK